MNQRSAAEVLAGKKVMHALIDSIPEQGLDRARGERFVRAIAAVAACVTTAEVLEGVRGTGDGQGGVEAGQ